MHWSTVIVSILPSLLIEASPAAFSQQPLGGNKPTRSELSDAYIKLQEEVGNRLIQPSPFAKPCYLPDNEAECKDIYGKKTLDTWISDQPGGYFYVLLPSLPRVSKTQLTFNRVTGHHVKPRVSIAVYLWIHAVQSA